MKKKLNFIESLIDMAKKHLPLVIERVYWDGTMLNLSGYNWHFNSLSDWRLVKNSKLALGSSDQDTTVETLSLMGISVIDITIQSRLVGVDPVFILSNNQILEIFSTDTYEPWTFSIDDEQMYCASPAVPDL